MPDQLYETLKSRSIPIRFQRTVGLLGATTLGIGAIMGAGIYVLIGLAAQQAGPGVWLAYLVCGLLAFFSVFLFGRMSQLVPTAGGGYAYAYEALGAFWGFVAGWHLAIGSIFACSLYAVGFSFYATSLFVHSLAPWLFKGVAVALVAMLTLLNSRSAAGSDTVQRIFTWGNIAVLLALVLLALRNFAPENLSPTLPNGIQGVASAVAIIYVSFFGYQLIANNAEEIKQPLRTVPLAMTLSLLISLAVYLAVAVVSVGIVPWNELGQTSAPLAEVARKAIGRWGLWLVGIGGTLASAAALNGTLQSQARQIFAMGRDRLFPPLIGKLHEASRTPRAALGLGGIGIVLSVALGTPEFLAKSASFCFLVSMLPVSFALFKLQRSRKTEPEGMSLALRHRLLPWAALASNLVVLATLGTATLTFGGVIAGVGLLLFYFYSKKREVRGRTGMSVDLSKESFSSFHLPHYRILVPLANPETQGPLFSISSALISRQTGEIVLLNVVEAPNQVDFYTALNESPEEAITTLMQSSKLASQTGVSFRPIVRVSRDMAKGIVHAAEEERCNLIVMGYSESHLDDREPIMERVLAQARTDIAFIKIKGQFAPKKIGVSLGSSLNLELIVKLAGAVADCYGASLDFFNILPSNYTQEQKERSGHLLIGAIQTHAAHALYRIEVATSDQPLDFLMEKSQDLDLLVVGTSKVSLLERAVVGPFSSQLAQRAKCSVAIVRAVPFVKRLLAK